MKKRTSLFRHLFLSKNFIMMLVMLVVIIVAVSAWFTVNRTVTANNICVEAKSTSVQIAKCMSDGGPGEFVEKIEFNGPFEFKKDCTGNGETLIVPKFKITKDYESVRRNGGKEVNEGASGTPAVCFGNQTEDDPEYHYFEYQFFLRSNSPDIYLDDSSILLSKREKVDGQSLFTNSGSPKTSDYGNNVDGLVGAIRVSLQAQACSAANQTWTVNNNTKTVTAATASLTGTSPERQVLWDPRPDVHLDIPESQTQSWSLTQNESFTGYTPTYYINNTNTDGVLLINDDQKAKVSNRMGSYNGLDVPYLSESVKISDFSAGNDFDGTVSMAPDKDHTESADFESYYLVKYTMRIWIEGTDNEARRAMDGGEFYLMMNFR